MDDVKLAMLGNKDAAKRLTDAGVLVPCAHCGNDNHNRIVMSFKKDKKKRFGEYYDVCTIYCECCTETVRQAGFGKDVAAKNASLLWNTRAPILSAEELKKLEEEA
jgi:hypothetical protein